jgi:hypothetical protein
MGCKGSRVQISALRPVFQSRPKTPGGPVSGPICGTTGDPARAALDTLVEKWSNSGSTGLPPLY